MKLAKEIEEGGLYPRGYGVAFDRWDFGRPKVVCYPVPLNILARFIRSAYFALRRGPTRYGRLTPPKLVAARLCYVGLLLGAFWAGTHA